MTFPSSKLDILPDRLDKLQRRRNENLIHPCLCIIQLNDSGVNVSLRHLNVWLDPGANLGRGAVEISPRNISTNKEIILLASVADPFHFDMDPENTNFFLSKYISPNNVLFTYLWGKYLCLFNLKFLWLWNFYLVKTYMNLANFLLPGSVSWNRFGSGWPRWNGSKRIRIRNTTTGSDIFWRKILRPLPRVST